MTDIKKLKEIIDEIDVLINKRVHSSDPEFEAWHDMCAKIIVILTLPPGSMELSRNVQSENTQNLR